MAEGSRHVRASDGTTVRYVLEGRGPPLVLVHGGLDDAEAWRDVVAVLAPHRTCVLLERRAARASIADEAGDLRAVLQAVGPAAVAAHGSGAVVALETPGLDVSCTALVLYEPTLPLRAAVAGAPARARMRHALERGRDEEALEAGLRAVGRITEEGLETLRASALWPGMLRNVASWAQELAALDALPAGVERYATIGCRTLLLLGELTGGARRAATEALARTIPGARVERLEDQAHLALHTAPDVVAARILAFLDADAGGEGGGGARG